MESMGSRLLALDGPERRAARSRTFHQSLLPPLLTDVVLTPAQQVRKAKLQNSRDEKVKQEKYDFDNAPGCSEEDIQKRLPLWYNVHLGAPQAKFSKWLVEQSPEDRKKRNDEFERSRREWDSEANYGRMVRTLGGVPTGSCWHGGELKGPYYQPEEDEPCYKRLGRDSPETAPKRSRKN